jgi:hypothetical protein
MAQMLLHAKIGLTDNIVPFIHHHCLPIVPEFALPPVFLAEHSSGSISELIDVLLMKHRKGSENDELDLPPWLICWNLTWLSMSNRVGWHCAFNEVLSWCTLGYHQLYSDRNKTPPFPLHLGQYMNEARGPNVRYWKLSGVLSRFCAIGKVSTTSRTSCWSVPGIILQLKPEVDCLAKE